MSSRPKEKVAAAFRKLFRPSEKIEADPSFPKHSSATGGVVGGGPSGGNAEGSGVVGVVVGSSPGQPARRPLLSRHGYHRDSVKVSPAEGIPGLMGSPGAVVRGHHHHHHHHKNSKAVFVMPAGGGGKTSGSGSGGSAMMMTESSVKHAKIVRTRRLMKEFQEIQKSCCGVDPNSPIFSVELVNDNLFEWNVKLFRIDSDSDLYKDMKELNVPFIQLNLHFPENFPFAPPFMRVITPRIEKGFVMEGGAICMELLTPRGWASAYTVEAVIMQFAASLVKGQGRIARKQKGTKEFSKRSAEESFRSLVKTHEKYGWVTPPLADG